MAELIWNTPLIPFAILFVLSYLDLILGRLARRYYNLSTSKFIQYEAIDSIGERKRIVWLEIVLKALPPILLLFIWMLASSSENFSITVLYWALLGFSMMLYLIIDLRHLESIFISSIYKAKAGQIEGSIKIGQGVSMMQSSIQLFSIMIILLFVAVLVRHIFFFAASLAPLTLILRNLILAKS